LVLSDEITFILVTNGPPLSGQGGQSFFHHHTASSTFSAVFTVL
jgi:hypothetical protein